MGYHMNRTVSARLVRLAACWLALLMLASVPA